MVERIDLFAVISIYNYRYIPHDYVQPLEKHKYMFALMHMANDCQSRVNTLLIALEYNIFVNISHH